MYIPIRPGGTIWHKTDWSPIGRDVLMKLSGHTFGRALVTPHTLRLAPGTYGLVVVIADTANSAEIGTLHLFIDLLANQGRSITNTVELVAEEAAQRFGPPRWYAEHYEGDFPQRVDQICFSGKRKLPDWFPVFRSAK